jgi:hypothetical protein
MTRLLRIRRIPPCVCYGVLYAVAVWWWCGLLREGRDLGTGGVDRPVFSWRAALFLIEAAAGWSGVEVGGEGGTGGGR